MRQFCVFMSILAVGCSDLTGENPKQEKTVPATPNTASPRSTDSTTRPRPDPITGSTFTNSIGMKLVPISAGEFKMGSGKSAAEIAKLFDIKEAHIENEHPQHLVRLTRDFYLGAHEVTQGQWKAVMKTTPWKGQRSVREGDNYPATYVRWEDVVEYCRLLSKKDGRKYRLPTEAEWEYSCRAGATTAYSFGADASELKNYAWFRENAWDVDEKYAHKVGQKRPNAWGLYDMHGNVFEWCSDWYGKDYYAKSPGTNPSGPASGSSRVLRGGSWGNDPQLCRSAWRDGLAPALGNNNFGFRVVCASD